MDQKTKIELFAKPYRNLDNAFADASQYVKETGETVHIIETTFGFEVVRNSFKMDRNYYHGNGGVKVFFTHIDSIEPDEKQILNEVDKKENKRLFEKYGKFKEMRGTYNAARIDGDVFTLFRLKDESVITRFNVHTFETIN